MSSTGGGRGKLSGVDGDLPICLQGLVKPGVTQLVEMPVRV